MSKKIMKRSLALGALMAFVITGSAWAETYNGTYTNNIISKNDAGSHVYGAYSNDGAVVTGAKFENNKIETLADDTCSYGGAMFVTGDLTVSNSDFIGNSAYGNTGHCVHGGAIAQENGALTIRNSTFHGNKVLNEKNKDGTSSDSYGAAIYSGGSGDVLIENSVFKNQDGGRAIYIVGGNNEKTATFKDNKFLNNNRGSVQAQDANTTLNFEGKNEFINNVDPTGVIAETLFNKGTTNFKKGSETIFSGNQLDIKNNGIVNIEKGATVTLGTGMTGSGNVNIDGVLTGRVFAENSANKVVLNNGGTWNLNGDSVVSGITVSGNATIDGTKGDGNTDDKYTLTASNHITDTGKYFITHNAGDLTIKDLIINGVVKDVSTDKDHRSRGSVVYGYGKHLEITNSKIINNINRLLDSEGNIVNDTSYHYAVIYTNCDVTIDNTEFANNITDNMGGVLYVSKMTNITDSKFVNNIANQGAAIQSNSAKINFYGKNEFSGNEATKTNGECGGAICTEGASEIIFYGNTTFKENKATGEPGNGGAIAQYHNGGKIVFAAGSVTNFKNNTATGYGGAIYNKECLSHSNNSAYPNDSEAIIQIHGDVNFEGNRAAEGNDIYNERTLQILGGTTTVEGGIVSKGNNAFVEISNDATLVLAGGKTYLNRLVGDGGTIRFANVGENLLKVDVNENKTLKFTATGKVNEVVGGDASKINELISQVDWADDTTISIDAGDIVGEVSAKLVENKTTGKLMVEEGSITEKANPANQAVSNVGFGLKLFNRAHMNDMNKRMGELRDANGEHGVWARMVRGESEYENVKAQYNQYQLGYDEKLSVDKRWTVGASATFAEGEANYGYGSTEDKSTAFAIYGSKLNNDGTFVDLIARYARIESDVDDQAGKGDLAANGMSVSAEFGKRIQQGNGLWLEPQVELTYGTLEDAEMQLGNKTVQVGDVDSLIGRVGFRIGQDIEKGNVYARASYLYDFDGEAATSFTDGTVTRSFKDDLGGGWWEVGVGANINLSKATYIYADVEKTFGGEVDTNWQWNLGVRYSF